MDQLIVEFTQLLEAFIAHAPFALSVVGVLCAIHVLNVLCGYRLNYLGIVPRRVQGLAGILFSPFLHGNVNHLFFNAIPLFILVDLVMNYGMTAFYHITFSIIVFSGLGIWLFGRLAVHIGASSLIMGYWSFLLTLAILERTSVTLVLGVVCLYYLGGLASGLVPTDKNVSWEGHIFGFLAGILVAKGWIL